VGLESGGVEPGDDGVEGRGRDLQYAATLGAADVWLDERGVTRVEVSIDEDLGSVGAQALAPDALVTRD